MNLLGLSGTNGSGKDTVGHMLVDRHNWLFVSVSDLLRIEATRRGRSLERNTLAEISAEWRRQHGYGVLVDKAVEHYESIGGQSRHDGLVIASLRHPGEAERVKQLGGRVVWVDADPTVRYERIVARRRADDEKTYQQFLAEEQRDMEQSGDAATLQTAAVKDLADVELFNNTTAIEDFQTQAEQQLVV